MDEILYYSIGSQEHYEDNVIELKNCGEKNEHSAPCRQMVTFTWSPSRNGTSQIEQKRSSVDRVAGVTVEPSSVIATNLRFGRCRTRGSREAPAVFASPAPARVLSAAATRREVEPLVPPADVAAGEEAVGVSVL